MANNELYFAILAWGHQHVLGRWLRPGLATGDPQMASDRALPPSVSVQPVAIDAEVLDTTALGVLRAFSSADKPDFARTMVELYLRSAPSRSSASGTRWT